MFELELVARDLVQAPRVQSMEKHEAATVVVVVVVGSRAADPLATAFEERGGLMS